MMLRKLPVRGRPAYLDNSRRRAYCACNRCGWGLFGRFFSRQLSLSLSRRWPGGAMVLYKLSVPGVLLIWMRVGQGPTALAVGAGLLRLQ